MTSTSKEYIVPDWGLESNEEHIEEVDFSLEVLKNGQIIDNIILSKIKSFYIFGRQDDIVDHVIEHPSLSRQHAVFQYRKDGSLMLLDFNSAQGVFVNKKKVDSNIYHRLYVGDMIKFGNSTRFYVVNGPESHQLPEYDSLNLQKYREDAHNKNIALQNKAKEGISWGIRNDDDIPETETEIEMQHKESNNHDNKKKLPRYLVEDTNYERKYGDLYSIEENIITFESNKKLKASKETGTGSINELKSDVDAIAYIATKKTPKILITEKENKLIEKLRRNQTKIQNMQQENRKIFMKETMQGELSEGQLSAVSKHDEKIDLLIEENTQLLYSLTKKDTTTATTAIEVGKTKKKDFDDEESDNFIYDTTKETSNLNTNWRLRKKLKNSIEVNSSSNSNSNHSNLDVNGMTFEDLVKYKDKLMLELKAISDDIQKNQNKLETTIQHLHSSTDEIDTIMYQNRQEELSKALNKLENSLFDKNNTIKKATVLIELTKPALLSLANFNA